MYSKTILGRKRYYVLPDRSDPEYNIRESGVRRQGVNHLIQGSFHHIRSYSRSQSSIKVDKPIFNRAKELRIAISYEKEEWSPVCDLCDGEDFPLCIRFCPENIFKFGRRNV
jgi:hypothetical protein